jgi:hypothetical protein
MPFTLNGIGTTLYGARDFLPNGSYVTTEWLVFIYVPVLPLKSIRILSKGDPKFYGVYRSSTYAVLERPRLNLRQVFSIYGWCAVLAASFLTAAEWQSWWFAIPGALAIPVPWFLRRKARERMTQERERRKMGFAPLNSEKASCPKCGVPLAPGAGSCSSCGQPG